MYYKKYFLRWIFCICYLFCCGNLKAEEQTSLKFKRVVIFGDSYSDNGNDFRLTKGKYPGSAYTGGRFTNGKVWSEYFATLLGINIHNPDLFLNFAYGQAQINGVVPISVREGKKEITYQIPDLKTEIDQYFQTPIEDPTNALFVIFLGTNDFLNLGDTIEPATLIKNSLNVEEVQINRLINSGVKHIIIFNMRELNMLPYVQTAAELSVKNYKVEKVHEYTERYRKLVLDYNQALNLRFKNNPAIFIFDAYEFDNSIHQAMKKGDFKYTFAGHSYALTEAQQPCYINNGNYQDKVSPICKNPQRFFYFDRAHPTTYVHYLMAHKLKEALPHLK